MNESNEQYPVFGYDQFQYSIPVLVGKPQYPILRILYVNGQ